MSNNVPPGTDRRAAEEAGPEAAAAYSRVRSELRRIRQESLLAQIRLVRDSYPEVWADAERFVTETYCQPWDLVMAFQEGQLGALQEKYEAQPSRRRPHHDDVGPMTDLFYEACELVARRLEMEREGANLVREGG